MQDEYRKCRLFSFTSQLLLRSLHVLFQLFNSILKRRSCIIDLIDNQNILSYQIRHLERAHIQPLCSCDLGAWSFNIALAEIFVEGETDGLDRDIGGAWLLEERSV